MAELAAAFGYCLLAGLVTVIPSEVYLFGAAALTPMPGIWLALAGAVGQTIGKMAYYLVGRGVLNSDRLRTRTKGKWVERMQRVETWCQEHVAGLAVVAFISSFVGLPPYALVAVLAGSLRMRWWVFALLSLVGRFLRFWAVVEIPELLPGALFGL
ncbi:MAG TPA: VTT domain-containing protein [Beutenbergiaceae bacterium]|nr:VTT domain-containing protein [Beutenbergiaceae bacterium]